MYRIAVTNRHLCEGDFLARITKIAAGTAYDAILLREHPYLHLPLNRWDEWEEKESLRNAMREIGTSVHSVEQAKKAMELGADYITAGHIFLTDCKKGLPPRGLNFLQQICAITSVPVYGIGGVKKENEQSILECGAKGVCIMSGCMRE